VQRQGGGTIGVAFCSAVIQRNLVNVSQVSPAATFAAYMSICIATRSRFSGFFNDELGADRLQKSMKSGMRIFA